MLTSSFKASTLSVETKFKDLASGVPRFVPQRVALFAQGASAATFTMEKREVFNAAEAGTIYGFGSPIHIAALTYFHASIGGAPGVPFTVYPLEQGAGVAAAGAVVATVGSITKTTTGYLKFAGIKSADFSIVVGDTATTIHAKLAAAITATQSLPVTATSSAVSMIPTAKWKGTTGNDVKMELFVASDCGCTFALTQLTGGTIVPDITAPLELMANDWETWIINGAGIATAELDEYSTFAESRWSSFTQKPLVVVSGYTEAAVGTAVSTTSSRKLDRGNVILCIPSAKEHPVMIAAAAVRAAVQVANEAPGRDYRGQKLAGIAGGPSSAYWTPEMRDTAIKAGMATVELMNGVPVISDLVTCYHPDNEPDPGYRYANDIVKLQQVLHGVNLAFNNDNWYGAILVKSDDIVDSEYARTETDAKAAIMEVVKGLVLKGVLTDYEYSKTNTTVTWVGPRRGESYVAVKLSGNASVMGMEIAFGFAY